VVTVPGAALPGGGAVDARAAAWLDGTAPSPLAPAASGAVARYAAGDTSVALLQIGTDARPAAFTLGTAGLLAFPYAGQSVCEPATSGYGPGTWDAPCQGAARPVRVVAKVWINAEGRVATEFQPALRFTPGLPKPVQLVLKDRAAAGTRVDYCTAAGCVDESETDRRSPRSSTPTTAWSAAPSSTSPATPSRPTARAPGSRSPHGRPTPAGAGRRSGRGGARRPRSPRPPRPCSPLPCVLSGRGRPGRGPASA
jgi:hypothetical protein